jgi:hypothetical protein
MAATAALQAQLARTSATMALAVGFGMLERDGCSGWSL